MGKTAQHLAAKNGIDVKKLIEKLNRAYCDEWLAYIQYWSGAQIAVGFLRGPLSEEMKEHAKEELSHAEELAARIIQLGGEPVSDPKEWYKFTNCGYAVPKDVSTAKLLKQNIEGERCAIAVYSELLKFVSGKDPVTEKLVLGILEDELEHEHDLEDIETDMKNICCKK